MAKGRGNYRLTIHKTPALAERKFRQYKRRIISCFADATQMRVVGKTNHENFFKGEAQRIIAELRRWAELNDYEVQAEDFIAPWEV